MKLTHPESDQTVEVDKDHADQYLSQGWAEKKAPRSRKPDVESG